jgi:hypothetical protein
MRERRHFAEKGKGIERALERVLVGQVSEGRKGVNARNIMLLA